MAQKLKKIRVSIPITVDVNYVINVKNPKNIDEIITKLENMDPTEWESDPCFYEYLGDEWRDAVKKVRLEDIEVLEE